jgi:hypothetical protein
MPSVPPAVHAAIAAAAIFALAVAFRERTPGQTVVEAGNAAAEAARNRIDKGPEIQADRARFIAQLQAEGVLGKVNCSTYAADAKVTAAFDALPFDEKQSALGVVYAFCFDSKKLGNFVTLRSQTTNKDLGTYTVERGLVIE